VFLYLSGRPVAYDDGLHLDFEGLYPLSVGRVQLFPEGCAHLLQGPRLLQLLLVALLPQDGQLNGARGEGEKMRVMACLNAVSPLKSVVGGCRKT